MDRLLALFAFLLAAGVMIFAYPDGPGAVLFAAVVTTAAIILINKNFEGDEKIFVRRIFLVGLFLRVGLAAFSYVYGFEDFFGGDARTYDNAGNALYQTWFGDPALASRSGLNFAYNTSGSGWGMSYLVGFVYSAVGGRNPLATQLFNSVLGAGTVCFVYMCSKQVFKNIRVATVAAVFVAVFPSLVVWSSQGLKDGIICFLLALAMTLVLSIQKKFDYFNIFLLLLALAGIYALRFYIFFAFMVAIFGSFFLGAQKSVGAILRQLIVLVVITLGLTYMGVLRNAQSNVETFGSLERLQMSRQDQATSANSGYGQDIDVSTPTGAIQALPIGIAYLLLAPFPWQMANFRQAVTLPESLVWWGSIPFLITGLWYTLKNKLRESIGILLLTFLLTIAYAIFQGNVGTAYRMRAQMQIFYFIFVAVGYVLWKEKRENQALLAKRQKRQPALQKPIAVRRQA